MQKHISTRMHSSRMSTVRSSSRLLGGHLLPGGCLLLGVSASFGGGGLSRGCVSQHALGQTPPCGQNDRQA